MAGLGAGLVLAAPAGPGQPVSDGVDGVGDEFGEQAADFIDGQRDQFSVVWWSAGAFTGGDDGEDGVGEHDQGGVPVPGVEAADLMFVQPGGVLAGLEGGFDAPAASGCRPPGPGWAARPGSVTNSGRTPARRRRGGGGPATSGARSARRWVG